MLDWPNKGVSLSASSIVQGVDGFSSMCVNVFGQVSGFEADNVILVYMLLLKLELHQYILYVVGKWAMLDLAFKMRDLTLNDRQVGMSDNSTGTSQRGFETCELFLHTSVIAFAGNAILISPGCCLFLVVCTYLGHHLVLLAAVVIKQLLYMRLIE